MLSRLHRSSLVALLCVLMLALGSIAFEVAASPEGKYSILFAYLSDDYRHNGKPVTFPKDRNACAIFFASDNPKVVALAEDLQDLIYLRVKLKAATEYWRKAAMDPQELRKNIINRMIDEIPLPATRENQRNFADDIMTDLQLSVPSNTRAIASAQFLMHLQKMQQSSLPPILEERFPNVPETADALGMSVTLEPGKLPAEMTLVNKGSQTLHNALVWYFLEVEEPPGFNEQEKEALRFARDMGFRKAVKTKEMDRELQDIVTGLGSRNIIFIPELKPNDAVKIKYDLGAVRRCKQAQFSLICDELKATDQNIEGVKEMQQKIEAMAAPRSAGSPAAGGNAPAKSKPAAKKPAPDALTQNSVWRGTVKVGSAAAQQLELTVMQRDGDQFKGRVSFNRRGANGANGSISGNEISWSLVVRGQETDLKYTGQLKGNQITGTFSGPGSNNQAVEGNFTLSLVPANRK